MGEALKIIDLFSDAELDFFGKPLRDVDETPSDIGNDTTDQEPAFQFPQAESPAAPIAA